MNLMTTETALFSMRLLQINDTGITAILNNYCFKFGLGELQELKNVGDIELIERKLAAK